eukprot:679421-Pleurochrysis_carterae.AAC.1
MPSQTAAKPRAVYGTRLVTAARCNCCAWQWLIKREGQPPASRMRSSAPGWFRPGKRKGGAAAPQQANGTLHKATAATNPQLLPASSP